MVLSPELQTDITQAFDRLVTHFVNTDPDVANAALETAGCLVHYDAARLILRDQGLISALVNMTAEPWSRRNRCEPLLEALFPLGQYDDLEISETDKARIAQFLADLLSTVHDTVPRDLRDALPHLREPMFNLRFRLLNGATFDPAYAQSRLQWLRNKSLRKFREKKAYQRTGISSGMKAAKRQAAGPVICRNQT